MHIVSLFCSVPKIFDRDNLQKVRLCYLHINLLQSMVTKWAGQQYSSVFVEIFNKT